jgi:hypothetical protein
MRSELRLRCRENGESGSGTAEMEQASTAGRDKLVVASAGAEKVAEFVAAFAEALG